MFEDMSKVHSIICSEHDNCSQSLLHSVDRIMSAEQSLKIPHSKLYNSQLEHNVLISKGIVHYG